MRFCNGPCEGIGTKYAAATYSTTGDRVVDVHWLLECVSEGRHGGDGDAHFEREGASDADDRVKVAGEFAILPCGGLHALSGIDIDAFLLTIGGSIAAGELKEGQIVAPVVIKHGGAVV